MSELVMSDEEQFFLIVLLGLLALLISLIYGG